MKLEELPMHELKARCKEKGLSFKNTSKKKDLIRFLVTGKSDLDKPREVKKAPTMEDHIKPKAVPLLPKNFEHTIATKFPTLGWKLNEKDGCIEFFPKTPECNVIPSCVNVDSNERIIYKVAEEAARGRLNNRPHVYDQNNVQAARIEAEQRAKEIERRRIEEEVKASVTQ